MTPATPVSPVSPVSPRSLIETPFGKEIELAASRAADSAIKEIRRKQMLAKRWTEDLRLERAAVVYEAKLQSGEQTESMERALSKVHTSLRRSFDTRDEDCRAVHGENAGFEEYAQSRNAKNVAMLADDLKCHPASDTNGAKVRLAAERLVSQRQVDVRSSVPITEPKKYEKNRVGPPPVTAPHRTIPGNSSDSVDLHQTHAQRGKDIILRITNLCPTIAAASRSVQDGGGGGDRGGERCFLGSDLDSPATDLHRAELFSSLTGSSTELFGSVDSYLDQLADLVEAESLARTRAGKAPHLAGAICAVQLADFEGNAATVGWIDRFLRYAGFLENFTSNPLH